MIRIITYVILLFLIAAGFAWLADRPGEMTVTWQGMQYQVTLQVAVTAIAALIALVMLLWWLVRTLIRSPDLIRRHFRARKRDRGYQSLSTGIIAAGAGDSAAARRMAKQAGKPVVYHEIADYAHGPAWTRKIMGDQLRHIEDYLLRDCGAKGL